MYKHKLKYKFEQLEAVQNNKNIMFEKRKITSYIGEIKQKLMKIKGFDITPTHENLFDISERIKVIIIEIKFILEKLVGRIDN